MLKILIKKQFFESFRSYFVNPKTGKKRSTLGCIGMFALFVFVMLVLCIAFVGMTYNMTSFLNTEYEWLYFALLGFVAMMIGIFGSVFNTYSSLYLAKDNDLLLSMPIEAGDILKSRICLVLGLSFLYTGAAWLPGLIMSFIFGSVSILKIVYGIVLFLAIGLFVCTITCALGYIVALISVKIKNRSFVTLFLTIAFLGIYYFLCFNLENVMNSLMANQALVGEKITVFANLLYQLGMGASGHSVNFFIFVAVSTILFVLCFVILKRSFVKIATSSNDVNNVKVKVSYSSLKSSKSALLKKEFKRFTSSTLYVLNTGLGAIFVLALPVVVFIKRGDLDNFFMLIKEVAPVILDYLPLAIIVVVCLIISMDLVSTPSISLEGKNLWILKTMPVKTIDVLEAKERLHLLVNGIPTIISVIALGVLLKIDYYNILLMLIVCLLFIDFQAILGLIIGLLRPNFSWSNESQPIKQSLNVLIMMLICWIFVILMGVGAFLLRDYVDGQNYILYLECALLIIVVILKRWLRSKGCKVFDAL